MALIDGMLQELEQEAQTTRRVLERVPDNQLAWRPHEKARTLGELALHVAMVPGAVAELVARDDQQVDVARRRIEIAQRERALQVEADQPFAEQGPQRVEVLQDGCVHVGIGGRPGGGHASFLHAG